MWCWREIKWSEKVTNDQPIERKRDICISWEISPLEKSHMAKPGFEPGTFRSLGNEVTSLCMLSKRLGQAHHSKV